MPDESIDEIGKGFQKASLDHQLPRQNEEWHCQQRKAIHPLKHPLRNKRQGIIADQQVNDRTEDQVECDRKPDHQQHNKTDTQC